MWGRRTRGFVAGLFTCLVAPCLMAATLSTVSSEDGTTTQSSLDFGGWKPMNSAPPAVTFGRAARNLQNNSAVADETRRSYILVYPSKSGENTFPVDPAAAENKPGSPEFRPPPVEQKTRSPGFRPVQKNGRQLSPPLRAYPTQVNYHRLRNGGISNQKTFLKSATTEHPKASDYRPPAVVYQRSPVSSKSKPQPGNIPQTFSSPQASHHQIHIQLLDGFIVPSSQGMQHYDSGEKPTGGRVNHVRAVPITLNDVPEIKLLLPGDVHEQLAKLQHSSIHGLLRAEQPENTNSQKQRPGFPAESAHQNPVSQHSETDKKLHQTPANPHAIPNTEPQQKVPKDKYEQEVHQNVRFPTQEVNHRPQQYQNGNARPQVTNDQRNFYNTEVEQNVPKPQPPNYNRHSQTNNVDPRKKESNPFRPIQGHRTNVQRRPEKIFSQPDPREYPHKPPNEVSFSPPNRQIHGNIRQNTRNYAHFGNSGSAEGTHQQNTNFYAPERQQQQAKQEQPHQVGQQVIKNQQIFQNYENNGHLNHQGQFYTQTFNRQTSHHTTSNVAGAFQQHDQNGQTESFRKEKQHSEQAHVSFNEQQQKLTEFFPVSPQQQKGTESFPEPPRQQKVTEFFPESPQQQKVTEFFPEAPQQQKVTEFLPEAPQQQKVTEFFPELPQQQRVTESFPEPPHQQKATEFFSEPQRQQKVAEFFPESQQKVNGFHPQQEQQKVNGFHPQQEQQKVNGFHSQQEQQKVNGFHPQQEQQKVTEFFPEQQQQKVAEFFPEQQQQKVTEFFPEPQQQKVTEPFPDTEQQKVTEFFPEPQQQATPAPDSNAFDRTTPVENQDQNQRQQTPHFPSTDHHDQSQDFAQQKVEQDQQFEIPEEDRRFAPPAGSTRAISDGGYSDDANFPTQEQVIPAPVSIENGGGTCQCVQNCAPIYHPQTNYAGSTLRETANQVDAGALFEFITLRDDEIEALLASTGTYTLFLPSNEAVSRIPQNLLEMWRQNDQDFSLALLNHVVSGTVSLDDLKLGGRMGSRVPGSTLFINNYNKEAVTVNGHRIVRGDIPGSRDGTIHVVDGMLCPVGDLDIIDTLRSCNKYDGFLTLAHITNLMDKLREEGPFTVFLPGNDALSKIPSEELTVLKENVTALRLFLEYHIVQGVYFSGDLKDGQYLTTLLERKPLRVGVRVDGCHRRLMEVNNSPLCKADIPARNGVIHVLDWILRPSDLEWCDDVILP